MFERYRTKVDKLMLLGSYKDIINHVSKNKITPRHFNKIIINSNLNVNQIIWIYYTAKIFDFFADISCFRRLLYINTIDDNYIILFTNIILDIISEDQGNIIEIIEILSQSKIDKLFLFVVSISKFYLSIPLRIFHEILKLESKHAVNDLLVALYDRLDSNLNFETLQLLYQHGHFKFLENIIPSKKQLIDFYHLMN